METRGMKVNLKKRKMMVKGGRDGGCGAGGNQGI